MQYYHDLITEKSWQLLQDLKSRYSFILIGGWAVFLYTKALKSKDIDLIVSYEELEKLKQEFLVLKNDRLKKYEIKTGGVDIDIYLPFYSDLGLSAEAVGEYIYRLENFIVPSLEVLTLLKMKALAERRGSVKGRKDLIDLVSLLNLDSFDFDKLKKIALKYQVADLLEVTAREIKAGSHLPEMNLNIHQTARFKKRILPCLLDNS